MTLSLILLAAIAGVGALLWLMEQRTLRRQQDAPEPEPTTDQQVLSVCFVVPNYI